MVYVHVMYFHGGQPPVWIGRTEDIRKRIAEMQVEYGGMAGLYQSVYVNAGDEVAFEALLRQTFANHSNGNGWFDVSLDEINRVVTDWEEHGWPCDGGLKYLSFELNADLFGQGTH